MLLLLLDFTCGANTSLFCPFSKRRCRTTHAIQTRVTTRPSVTALWEISTAAAQMTTRAKPVQSSRTTARPISVKVTAPTEHRLTFSRYAWTQSRNKQTSWKMRPPLSIVLMPPFTFFPQSDWQLHSCCGNQWHSEAGVAHLIQCVRTPRPLYQSACRELQLLLWARIHRHLLPREWVIISTHRLYLSPVTITGTHRILTVVQTPVSLIFTVLVYNKTKNTRRKSR